MNDNIQLFNNESLNASLRVFYINGTPWFVAKDVCQSLGTKTSNVREILDPEEVMNLSQYQELSIGLNGESDKLLTDEEMSNLPAGFEVHGVSDNISDQSNGGRAPLIISESGLYHLAFVSRKPAARKFRHWVTDEVLPAIRKTGHYSLPDAAEMVHKENEWLKKQNSALVRDNTRMLDQLIDLTKTNKELQATQSVISYNMLLQRQASDLFDRNAQLHQEVKELTAKLAKTRK